METGAPRVNPCVNKEYANAAPALMIKLGHWSCVAVALIAMPLSSFGEKMDDWLYL